jgi:2-polyprenyl-3-methyl-5-hydroxy-6-metoxy-1,4-benzoquinol methylase
MPQRRHLLIGFRATHMPHTLPATALSVSDAAIALRFGFGANWTRFLAHLDEDRIREAERSLNTMLGDAGIRGRSFLDVGSGSGLFSLAAKRLGGARIHSMDFDRSSVACTAELRRRYFPDDDSWRVEQASALDSDYMGALGQFDVVYSWGVLHHTGDMWRGLELTCDRVAPGGLLLIAIYNDQGGASRRWASVKRIYNRLPAILQPAFAALVGLGLELRSAAIRAVRLQNPLPFSDWRARKSDRGMSMWHDLVDWVGGYPFEVAKPEQLFNFCKARGFRLEGMTTCGGGMGCNQLLFTR